MCHLNQIKSAVLSHYRFQSKAQYHSAKSITFAYHYFPEIFTALSIFFLLNVKKKRFCATAEKYVITHIKHNGQHIKHFGSSTAVF